VVHEIPAEWLPVRCKMNRLARAIGQDCRACARNICQEPSEVNTSCKLVIPNASVILRDFFLWGYIKDHVYVPPLPHDLPQLRQRFVEAVAAINRQMLQHVWQELDYRVDICHVTKGGHIEHL